MTRGKLFQYQNTYAIAMNPFGLQRGIRELAEAKKKLSDKDRLIEKLQQRISQLEQEQL